MRDFEEERPYLCYPFGVAETLKQHHGVHSLTQLIEERSKTFLEPVIGMPYKDNNARWTCDLYTYVDILNGINALCHYFLEKKILPERTRENGLEQMTMALVAPSNVDMMMVMLAAQRLGLAVLLITPNQTHKIIKHLCAELRVINTITQLEIEGLATTIMPPSSVWKDAIKRPGKSYTRILTPEEEGHTNGVIYHSSGTTTGLPKPLPSEHRFLVSFCAHKHTELATLTTTPLNTGGTADICRSMCADAMLFLFPDSVALTASNVCEARDACSKALGREVRALSCVPYVVKMLAENETSMKMLQRMQFLGVGGAPLPKSTGDLLVHSGVPLVSRMGSSECNFLMSSYRDYENDKDWDYLRSEPGGHHFKFIPQNDGTSNCELEVSGFWPALAVKPNHHGNFRTGDLFQPHPSTPHAWLYLGRSDDTIVLGNGKKADPKALESALRSLDYAKDALVFGVGKNNIGVFVIEADDHEQLRGDPLRKRLWDEVVENINKTSPSHAEVYYEMIRILPATATFEKTAKGSIIRNNTYARYKDEIDAAYTQSNEKKDISNKHLETYVTQLFQKVTGKKLGLEDDLFNAGVNSLQSVRIRNIMVGELDLPLPTNIVFEEPSIYKLTAFIRRSRSGDVHQSQDSRSLMLELVSKFSYDPQKQARPKSNGSHLNPLDETGETILLTGATGGLGSHLLNLLLSTTLRKIKRVICLIRAQSPTSPSRRMEDTLRYRKINLPSTDVAVEYLDADLSLPEFGLSPDVIKDLRSSVSLCIHAAWPVNFNASLISFTPSILSTTNLISFCLSLSKPPKFYFCSSTASIISSPKSPIPEILSHDPKDASPVGYSQSKWVTEQIMASYLPAFPPAHLGVFRIGQLCGDLHGGVWSESEAWSLMFASINVIGAMPAEVGEESVVWVPVDTAAHTILEIALASNDAKSPSESELGIWNIVNPNGTTTWNDILAFFKSSGFEFTVVEPREWVKLLGKSPEQDNPSKKLLHLWQSAFESTEKSSDPVFDTRKAVTASKSLRDSKKVDEELMHKIFATWKERGFLK